MEPGCVEETRAWLRRAEESLAAAEVLAREGYLPEAVSRAYYSMFYAARALLISRGITVHKHSAVIAAFGREFARTGTLASRHHRALIDAFRDRQACDYLTDDLPPVETVARHLAGATEFIAAARRLID